MFRPSRAPSPAVEGPCPFFRRLVRRRPDRRGEFHDQPMARGEVRIASRSRARSASDATIRATSRDATPPIGSSCASTATGAVAIPRTGERASRGQDASAAKAGAAGARGAGRARGRAPAGRRFGVEEQTQVPVSPYEAEAELAERGVDLEAARNPRPRSTADRPRRWPRSYRLRAVARRRRGPGRGADGPGQPARPVVARRRNERSAARSPSRSVGALPPNRRSANGGR